jgi:hypothetical protein
MHQPLDRGAGGRSGVDVGTFGHTPERSGRRGRYAAVM